MYQEHFGNTSSNALNMPIQRGTISFNPWLAKGEGGLSPQVNWLKGPHIHCIIDVYPEGVHKFLQRQRDVEWQDWFSVSSHPPVLLLSQLRRREQQTWFSCSQIKMTPSPLKIRVEMCVKSKETDGLLSSPILPLRLTVWQYLCMLVDWVITS